MRHWEDALRDGLASGSAASVASTAALALCGKAENGRAAAPTNAISHWLWGERATRVDRATARHTLTGYAIHHGASVFWATLYEKFRARGPRLTPQRIAGDAAAVAAIACFVDYHLTPPRLRPGFEQRLSHGALFAVYAAFGAGLAAATWWRQRRRD